MGGTNGGKRGLFPRVSFVGRVSGALSVPRSNYLVIRRFSARADLAWERLEGPVEGKPRGQGQLSVPATCICSPGFQLWGRSPPCPPVGVGVGGSWGKGLSHRDAQVSSRALLATDSGGPPEAGEAFGTDLVQRKEASLAKQWLPSEA